MRIFDKRRIAASKFWFYYFKTYWFIVLGTTGKHFKKEPASFTIGITTFLERYSIFCDLLKRLVYSFPGTEIIVTVNGHHNETLQMGYLIGIAEFCRQFSNVKTIQYIKPQGLSKMWNQIIINSSYDKVFLFNDDILFKINITDKIIESGILNEKIALIDDSFSHFLIDKNVIRSVGWFDERFTEIGGEDDDFHVRLVLANILLKRYRLNIFRSYKPSLKVNSYGKNIKEQVGGYSNTNSSVLFEKWDIKDMYFEGSVNIVKSQGNYWKLKTGMETPDFYKGYKN